MWAYLVLGLLSVLIMAYRLWHQERRISVLQRVPAVRLAQAEAGARVRVTGAVAPVGELATAPFSGTPCIAALGERWELTSRGTPFRCVERQVRAATFTIDDGTAVARVITDHVRCALKTLPATIATSGAARPFGAGVLAANMERMGNHQVREGFVSEGERVVVIATVRRTEAGELELVGSAAEPVVIYK
jgi:hypothetical protein